MSPDAVIVSCVSSEDESGVLLAVLGVFGRTTKSWVEDEGRIVHSVLARGVVS